MQPKLDFDNTEMAVIALIQHRNLKKAARAVGVHPVTLWRWLKLPHFREQLRQAQAQVYSHALSRLQEAASEAAEVLLAIMRDPNSPANSRLRAAAYVLYQSEKSFALDDIQLEEFELPALPAPDTAKTGAANRG